MGHTTTLSLALLLTSTLAACSPGDTTNSEDDRPGGFSGEGWDGGDAGPGEDGGGGDGEPVDTTLPTYPTVHPRIYLGAHKARLQGLLAAATPAATRFKARADQWLAGANVYNFAAWNGALLAQLTGTPAYCTKAIATVEAQVVAAEAAIAQDARPVVAFDSYLHVGELIGDLALVYDWCFEAVAPPQRARWITYANQAVANVWSPTTATWGGATHAWSGWSTNNPSNNYYYSFLRATMLLGLATKDENPRADEWLAQFRDAKILGQLVPTFTSDLEGGGSREGTGYGVAMRNLFELYDLWAATTGERLATRTTHARASMRAFIHQTMPTLDRVAPTGDHTRDATAAYFDYHRHYLQLLIALYPTDALAGRAKALLAASSVPAMTQGFMYIYDFLYDDTHVTTRALSGLGTAYYAAGIGELYARSGWDRNATWINLIAGAYTESHAHQDQGSLMIYKDGWLAHDVNIHSRSGLAQDTTAHGLVRITSNGAPVRQIASTTSTMHAIRRGAGWLYAAADLTPAYNGHAAVQKVHRELVYLQPDVIVVFDRVQTASGTAQTWQLATPVQPTISGNTATIANAGHQLRVTRLAPSAGALVAHDFRADATFSGGWRLDEPQAGGDQRYLHVLAIDGAAASLGAAGDAAHPGATIRLADGRTVTVTFARDTLGGSLTIDGVTTALTAGLDTLPE